MPFDLDAAPPRGTLTVTVRRADFEADFVGAADPSTYCILWILEPTRRRRRRTVVARRTMSPEWHETFALDDTSAEATAVIDVWREREGSTDEYFGKVTLPVAELRTLHSAHYELVQGRIELSAIFAPEHSTAVAAREHARGAETERLAPPAATAVVSSMPAAAIPAAFDAARSPTAVLHSMPRVHMDDSFEDKAADAIDAARSAAHTVVQSADGGGGGRGGGGGGGGARVEYFEYTHRGGDGTGPKENQDTFFALRLDEDNQVWGVLDGHGHDNGRIAAETARDSFKAFFGERANFARLRADADATMTDAFARANRAVREAILAQPSVFERDGQLVMADEASPLGYDVVDGGTTATLAVLLDRRTLVVAAVGDSCGVLATCSHGRVSARELVPEHSALNKSEYEQIGGGGCDFVYEYPDMYEQGHLPVWELGSKVRRMAAHARMALASVRPPRAPALGRAVACARRARCSCAWNRSKRSTVTTWASRRSAATAQPSC